MTDHPWKFKKSVRLRQMPDAYFRPEDILSSKTQIKAVQDAKAVLESFSDALNSRAILETRTSR